MSTQTELFAKALNIWIHEWKRRTGHMLYKDSDICKLIPISPSV